MRLRQLVKRFLNRSSRRLVVSCGIGGDWRPQSVSGPAPFISVGSHTIALGRLESQRAGAEVLIGEQCYLAPGSLIDCAFSIHIGSHVLVANDVIIADHDAHCLDWTVRQHDAMHILSGHVPTWSAIAHQPVNIGHHVWIGRRAIVLKGVSIGDRCVVGAGSVVTRSFPADCLIAGTPARVIRSLAAAPHPAPAPESA